MTNEDLFERVKKLKLPLGKYALFGSAPLGIRNLKDCHDIDIIVLEDLWNKYNGAAEWELKTPPNREDSYLWNNEIELWKNWKPGEWDIKTLIQEAEIIDGLPFVKLENVLKWKKLNRREKDFKDISILEEHIRNNK